MAIKLEFPPNYDQIKEAIPTVVDTQPIFCFGPDIYNPYGHQLDKHIIAHEAVHYVQQQAVGTPELWWQRYLIDPEFRVREEVQAYREQIRSFKQTRILTKWGTRIKPPFKWRKNYALALAQALSSPMYGEVINKARAYHLLTA